MTNPHCYLKSLSPELLLPILSHLPDLHSLDSLLRASPALYRVFDSQSGTIFKTVLAITVYCPQSSRFQKISSDTKRRRIDGSLHDGAIRPRAGHRTYQQSLYMNFSLQTGNSNALPSDVSSIISISSDHYGPSIQLNSPSTTPYAEVFADYFGP
ncbi:hypothetical protein NA56DRAFT_745018 [Hyaloscypha hepaticicola]|uniref:F-box domain-containing protein n=1 Tax=Hyaloscypha hepaticicola TaxID=2082293 RepID=A0A2J6QIE9_9HELO|nr:hypothetical protein NA56DRAFT_745018 [Hyaloscypha hepaticicola]